MYDCLPSVYEEFARQSNFYMTADLKKAFRPQIRQPFVQQKVIHVDMEHSQNTCKDVVR